MAVQSLGRDLFSRLRQAAFPDREVPAGRGAPGDRALYQAASLLLDYPSPELVDRVPLLWTLAEEQGHRADGFGPLLDRLEKGTLAEVQSEYVELFDLRRRCCLYLTYYQYGDTRRRGSALVEFTAAYRESGAEFDARELPDHLGVVLEFGAVHDLARCRSLLVRHRPGLELLRIALDERDSVWAGVVSAVTDTLPPVDGDGREAVRRLIAQGPPDEEIGLEAFTSSSYLESGARP